MHLALLLIGLLVLGGDEAHMPAVLARGGARGELDRSPATPRLASLHVVLPHVGQLGPPRDAYWVSNAPTTLLHVGLPRGGGGTRVVEGWERAWWQPENV